MDGVRLNVHAVRLADCPLLGLGRIGGAHDFAVTSNGVLAFQNLNDHGTGNHVVAEFAVKGALLVHFVKFLRLSHVP